MVKKACRKLGLELCQLCKNRSEGCHNAYRLQTASAAPTLVPRTPRTAVRLDEDPVYANHVLRDRSDATALVNMQLGSAYGDARFCGASRETAERRATAGSATTTTHMVSLSCWCIMLVCMMYAGVPYLCLVSPANHVDRVLVVCMLAYIISPA